MRIVEKSNFQYAAATGPDVELRKDALRHLCELTPHGDNEFVLIEIVGYITRYYQDDGTYIFKIESGGKSRHLAQRGKMGRDKVRFNRVTV